MPTIKIEGESIVFPSVCPACQMPVAEPYFYKKAQITQWVTFPIGYCQPHAEQLNQADKRLQTIRVAGTGTFFLLWTAATYLALRIYPFLRITQDDTLFAWALSVAVMMIVPLIGLFVMGGGALVRIMIHAFPGIVERIFDTNETKTIRKAVSVKDFKLRTFSLAGGPAQLQWAVFSVADPKYAQELQKLNPLSTLVE